MARTTDHDISPLLPKDFWLFIDARSITAEHRSRRQVPETDHDSPSRRRCSGCKRRAFWALVAFAGRARRRGWTREKAVAELLEHPATYDSMAKEGKGKENASLGTLAFPKKAAFGAYYETALERAAAARLLSVDVRTAQELLGFVIEAAQDQTADLEPGAIVGWSTVAQRLDDGPYRLPPPLTIERVWTEIEAACRAFPPAHRLLHRHLFSRSANGSRHTAATTSKDLESPVPVVEAIADDAGLSGPLDLDGAGVTEAVAARLIERSANDPALARALVRQAILGRFGPEGTAAVSRRVIDDIANDSVALARRGLAVRGAAEILRANELHDATNARAVVALHLGEVGLPHPYDLTTLDGRKAHSAWLAAATRDTLREAQELRLAAS